MAVEVDLIDHVSDLLASGDTKSIKTLIDTETFRDTVREKANDIIPVVSYYFNKDSMYGNPRVFKCAEKIVTVCAKEGHPKECLMEFLAQIESLEEIKFKVLLKPLQMVVLRIPDRKVPLMLCVFNVISSFIKTLPLPEYHHVDSKSKLLLDCDEKVQKIREIYNLIIEFYEPFVNELCEDMEAVDKRIRGLKQVLLQALFHLLGNPIVSLDLEFNPTGSSAFRSLCLVVVTFILRLEKDPLKFLALVENGDLITAEEEKSILKNFSSNDLKLGNLSVAVFFYMIFSENNNRVFNLPCVYDKLYIFQNILSLATVLLMCKETLVLQKGLFLCKMGIYIVDSGCVSHLYLDSDVHKTIIEALSTIAVYHDVEEDRKLAAELIKQHLFRFEPKAQFYILFHSINLANHSSIKGFFTTMLTNLVKETFRDDQHKNYFTGKRLFDLLNVYCRLDKGAESDLVENKDQILSALNLIIYLTRRDRENLSGIWNYTEILSEKFLFPLREAIDLSRAHYQLQLKSLDDPLKTENGAELAVTVEGQELGKMSKDEKKAVINSGLTVFDLIDHLLSRVTECVEDKPLCGRSLVASCQALRLRSTNTGESSDQSSQSADHNGQTSDQQQYEDNIRHKILQASLPYVHQYGWSKNAITEGANSMGYPGVIHGMFPQGGADLFSFFYISCNQELARQLKETTEALEKSDPQSYQQPQEFVRNAVETRLRMNVPYLAHWPQALALMTLPPNVPTALANLLTLVDDICYYAGDRSVDFDWYSRRVVLAAIYKMTELYMMQDQSPDHAATWQFLSRRIDEALQVHSVLLQSEHSVQFAKEVAAATFTTARNILGLHR